MKKILALLLAAVLVLGMAACAASPAAPTQTTSDTASDASDTPASNAETPAASSGAKLRFVTGGARRISAQHIPGERAERLTVESDVMGDQRDDRLVGTVLPQPDSQRLLDAHIESAVDRLAQLVR